MNTRKPRVISFLVAATCSSFLAFSCTSTPEGITDYCEEICDCEGCDVVECEIIERGQAEAFGCEQEHADFLQCFIDGDTTCDDRRFESDCTYVFDSTGNVTGCEGNCDLTDGDYRTCQTCLNEYEDLERCREDVSGADEPIIDS